VTSSSGKIAPDWQGQRDVLGNGLLNARSLRRGGTPLKWPLTALPLLALFVFVAGCQRAGAPARATARQQVHEFTPAVFYNEFSATTPPVLRVAPGDTVRTTTIDAAGSDDKGVSRGKAGNPQTGPFYVIGASPGDTVAVHLTRATDDKCCRGSGALRLS
jgi:hypothetical protein